MPNGAGMAQEGEAQRPKRRPVGAVALLLVGGIWYVLAARGWFGRPAFEEVFQAAVGVYLLYRWYVIRRGRRRSHPWYLGLALTLLIGAAQDRVGIAVPSLPILLLIVGLAVLLDTSASL